MIPRERNYTEIGNYTERERERERVTQADFVDLYIQIFLVNSICTYSRRSALIIEIRLYFSRQNIFNAWIKFKTGLA